jgi:hypothetical protein
LCSAFDGREHCNKRKIRKMLDTTVSCISMPAEKKPSYLSSRQPGCLKDPIAFRRLVTQNLAVKKDAVVGAVKRGDYPPRLTAK